MVRTNVDTSALDGRRSPFNLMNRRMAVIYLMPLVPRYTTICVEWLGLWRMVTSLNEGEGEGRKEGDGHV